MAIESNSQARQTAREAAAVVAAAAIIKPQVDRIENEIRTMSDLVRCHERDLYGEHQLPGLAQRLDTIEKLVPVVKMWIGVLSFLAATCAAAVITFIFRLWPVK